MDTEIAGPRAELRRVARRERVRTLVLWSWLALVAVALYVYWAHRGVVQRELEHWLSISAAVAVAVYVLSSCVRGFTLIPATFLLVAGMPFFSPLLLYAMTMLGVAVSASSLYFFAHAMGVDRLLEAKHSARLDKLRAVLDENAFGIVAGWSFLPFAPTDLICYACGTLRTGFARFLLAVLLGEGLICAAYVFLGEHLLGAFGLR